MDSGLDMTSQSISNSSESQNEPQEESIEDDGIITTEEELEGFYTVKSILREVINTERLQYKDTRSYFGINLDGKVTKTICRFRFTETKKIIAILNSEGKEAKKEISRLDEIYSVASMLIDRLNFLTKNEEKGTIPKTEMLES